MNFQIPADLAGFVRQEVESGRFPDETAVIVACVRAMKFEREESIAAIRESWESIECGEGIPIEEVDRMLRARHGLPARE